MQLYTHESESRRARERTRGKEQSYFKGVFVKATIIIGRNNGDSDSAAESDNDDNADDR